MMAFAVVSLVLLALVAMGFTRSPRVSYHTFAILLAALAVGVMFGAPAIAGDCHGQQLRVARQVQHQSYAISSLPVTQQIVLPAPVVYQYAAPQIERQVVVERQVEYQQTAALVVEGQRQRLGQRIRDNREALRDNREAQRDAKSQKLVVKSVVLPQRGY